MKAKARTAAIYRPPGNFIRRAEDRALATPAPAPGVNGSSASAALLLLLAFAATVVAILLVGPGPAAAAECPNEIRRQEQGITALALPDCRGYEMVSPGTFPQQWAQGNSRSAYASVDGSRLAYFEFYPGTQADKSGLFYLSKRGANGWSPEVAVPQETTGGTYMYACDPLVFYSEDLSRNVLQAGYHRWFWNERAGCKTSEAVLDPRELREYRNLFWHDNDTGAYELLSVYPPSATPSNSQFQGSSPDLDTVVFSAKDAFITPDDPEGVNTYVATKDGVRLLGYLPDGSPFVGSETVETGEQTDGRTVERLNAKLVGSENYDFDNGSEHPSFLSKSGDGARALFRRSVSSDGSKIFFYAGGNLYVRLNPSQPQSAVLGGICTEPAKACTVQVDESQGPGGSGGGRMSFASADGSKAFFTSSQKMTPDSTAEAGKEDIYEYDVDTGTLTDLTVHPGEAADVQNVTWVTPDGEYVFFVAQAALAPGALPGNCDHWEAGGATDFCNLYVAHDGQVKLVAALSTEDSETWGYLHGQCPPICSGTVARDEGDTGNPYGVGRMLSSPDGRYFAFSSSANLTGYDSGRVAELYVYDTSTENIECASCPAGVTPTEKVELGRNDNAGVARVAGFVGGAQGPGPVRAVTDNGRVFFETADPLVARDTNGAFDVYEFENGEQFLLSGGKTQNNAHFLDASADGGDVFLVTAEQLLPSDTDGAGSIYDVRAGGGYPEPPPLPGCEGEACRGAATGPGATPAAGTASFKGPGNPAQGHKRDCGSIAQRARRLSKRAKALRRQAKRADGAAARKLRQRGAQIAKAGKRVSKQAKQCRRANRGAGK